MEKKKNFWKCLSSSKGKIPLFCIILNNFLYNRIKRSDKYHPCCHFPCVTALYSNFARFSSSSFSFPFAWRAQFFLRPFFLLSSSSFFPFLHFVFPDVIFWYATPLHRILPRFSLRDLVARSEILGGRSDVYVKTIG